MCPIHVWLSQVKGSVSYTRVAVTGVLYTCGCHRCPIHVWLSQVKGSVSYTRVAVTGVLYTCGCHIDNEHYSVMHFDCITVFISELSLRAGLIHAA